MSEKNQSNFLYLSSIIKATRPIQWIKNLSLFAALIFTGTLYIKPYYTTVFWAFITFNLVTSAAYVFNDIIDLKSDRLHPIKKDRPIASGKLPIIVALTVSVLLATLSIYLASRFNPLFLLSVIAYLSLQALYSLIFKNIPIIDILVIASGFILRVYAGAFVINAHLSVWFLLCVISVALFLASGKRRAELNTIKETSALTRKSLGHYKRELLNSYVTMFGNAAWMSWALFTFYESPRATSPVWLFLAELSKATAITKLLMITIPVVIYGIMRYQNLIFEGKSEAPEKLLLTDVPLVLSVLFWIALVVWILYGGISVRI